MKVGACPSHTINPRNPQKHLGWFGDPRTDLGTTITSFSNYHHYDLLIISNCSKDFTSLPLTSGNHHFFFTQFATHPPVILGSTGSQKIRTASTNPVNITDSLNI